MAFPPTPAIVDDDGQAKVSDLLDVGVVSQMLLPKSRITLQPHRSPIHKIQQTHNSKKA